MCLLVPGGGSAPRPWRSQRGWLLVREDQTGRHRLPGRRGERRGLRDRRRRRHVRNEDSEEREEEGADADRSCSMSIRRAPEGGRVVHTHPTSPTRGGRRWDRLTWLSGAAPAVPPSVLASASEVALLAPRSPVQGYFRDSEKVLAPENQRLGPTFLSWPKTIRR